MARILIIDDDESMLDLEKMILVKGGHHVIAAKSALLGLDLLELYEVDLVILDIQMPRLDGFDFVNTIKRNPKLQNLAIAFISSSKKNVDIEQARKLGANFYLLKPIEKKDFLERVNSFLENKKTIKHQTISFEDQYIVDVFVKANMQVLSISDLGLDVLLRDDMQLGQKVEIPSSVFNGIFDHNILTKVSWIVLNENNEKIAFLEYVLQDRMMIKKIKKLIESKNQSPALLKYPKWR